MYGAAARKSGAGAGVKKLEKKNEGNAETLNSLSLVTRAACNSATIIWIHANEMKFYSFLSFFFFLARKQRRGCRKSAAKGAKFVGIRLVATSI